MYIKFRDFKHDWKVWYKLVALIAIAGFFISDYLMKLDAVSKHNGLDWAVNSSDGTLIAYDYLGFNIFYITGYTSLVTIMVFMWFLMSLIKNNIVFSRWERSFWISRFMTVAIVSYAAINFTAYALINLPTNLIIKRYAGFPIYYVLSEIFLNLLVPALIVFYVCYLNTISYERIFLEDFLKKYLPLVVIFPLVYMGTEIARSTILYYMANYDVSVAAGFHGFRFFYFEYLNPDVFGIHGAVWFAIFLTIYVGLLGGFTYLFHEVLIWQNKY